MSNSYKHYHSNIPPRTFPWFKKLKTPVRVNTTSRYSIENLSEDLKTMDIIVYTGFFFQTRINGLTTLGFHKNKCSTNWLKCTASQISSSLNSWYLYYRKTKYLYILYVYHQYKLKYKWLAHINFIILYWRGRYQVYN